jgi:hypothetical protein
MGIGSQLLLIPPAVALDLWYALRLRRAESAATLAGGSLLAGAVFLAVALPAIPYLLIYPRVDATTAPMMIVMSMALALWSGWVGARTGAWFGSLDRRAGQAAALSRRATRVSAGALAALAAFAAFFIATATPPM